MSQNNPYLSGSGGQGSMFSDILATVGAMESPEPDIRGKRVQFDPQVEQRTIRLLRDWGQNRKQWKNIFADFMRDFTAQTPQFEANIGAENKFLTWLRDPGGLEAKLAGIRAVESANDRIAQETEKKLALDFADNQSNFGRLAAGGTGSSADYARRLAAGTRIGEALTTRFLGRDTARERADLGAVTNTRLGTMGKINQNLNLLLTRKLLPQQLSDAELNNMISSLAGITNIRNAVSQPVFWNVPDEYDKAAAYMDLAANTAMDIGSIYSSGGMGGMSMGAGGMGTGGGAGGVGGGMNFMSMFGGAGGGGAGTTSASTSGASAPVTYVPRSIPMTTGLQTPSWYGSQWQ